MRSVIWGVVMGAALAPAADAEWIHQQSGKTLKLDLERTATRAFTQILLTNTGDRVHGGADAWSMGSPIKSGAGLGNWRSTTSTWRPEPDEPVAEVEWTGEVVMAIDAEARSGESAAMVMAQAEFKLIVDDAVVSYENLVHNLAIESEQDLISTLDVNPGGVGVQVPITVSTGHGKVELADSIPIPDGCRCGKTVQSIRHCYSFDLAHADGWYIALIDVGREADASTNVDAEVKEKVFYIDWCGK